jgi:hypothetical protein
MKTVLTTLLSLILSVAVAVAGNTTVTNSAAHPVPVTTVAQVGATALTTSFYSGHITTSTTTTVNSTTCYVSALVICVTSAGTGWSIAVRSKEATPTLLYYTSAATLGTFTPVNLNLPGVISPSGLEIATGGTAGVADIKITYSK